MNDDSQACTSAEMMMTMAFSSAFYLCITSVQFARHCIYGLAFLWQTLFEDANTFHITLLLIFLITVWF